jgi:hypothetical protein
VVGKAGWLARAEALLRVAELSAAKMAEMAEMAVWLETQPVGSIAPVELLAARALLVVFSQG